MLMAERISCTELAAEEAADEWCQLLASSSWTSPFQHPTWHATWWRHFGGDNQPLLLGVRDHGQLVALAPLMRAGAELRFASDPEITDYMDMVVAPDAPDEAYAALLDAVAE